MPRGARPLSGQDVTEEQIEAVAAIKRQFLESGLSIGKFVQPYGIRRELFGQVMKGRRAPSRGFLAKFGYRYKLVKEPPDHPEPEEPHEP